MLRSHRPASELASNSKPLPRATESRDPQVSTRSSWVCIRRCVVQPKAEILACSTVELPPLLNPADPVLSPLTGNHISPLLRAIPKARVEESTGLKSLRIYLPIHYGRQPKQAWAIRKLAFGGHPPMDRIRKRQIIGTLQGADHI